MKTKLSRMLFSIMFTLLVVAGGGLFGACASMEAKIEPEFPDEPSIVYSDALPLLVDGETLVRYIGEQNAIVDIPASYDIDENNNIIVGDTYKITKIADGAFKNVKFYDAYIDMSNVTEIGESAFENTKNITISEMLSLKKISAKAFYNSNINFKSLNLGNVEKIGKYSFSKTNKYEIPSNSTLKSIYANDINEWDGDNVYICSNNGICVVEDSAFYDFSIDNGEFRFGKGIAVIGDEAFNWCTGGHRCIFEGGTYYLGDAAFTRTSFYYCRLDGNFISIGDEIFKDCTNLNTVDIMQTANITTMNKNWFTDCTSLTKISRNADTNETSLSNNKGINFKYSSSFNAPFTSVGIPASVTSIEEGAFKGFGKLISMELPFIGASTNANTQTKYGLFGYIFGTEQFENATLTNQNYASYYIPNDLITVNAFANDELKAYAFYNCSHLVNITLSDTYRKIRGSSFYNCTGIIKFTIPNGVTVVGTYVFYGCSNLEALNIPSTITTSNNYENYWTTALDNCPKLTKVTRSATPVTKGGAINFCFGTSTSCGVKEFTVPNSVTQINAGVFTNFGSLESLTLPFIGASKNVNDGDWWDTFGYIFGSTKYDNSYNNRVENANDDYTNVYIPSSLNSVTITSAMAIRDYVFYGCSSITSLSIAGTYTSLGAYAFANCTGLSSFTPRAGTTEIGAYAFSGCTGLTSWPIISTITKIGTGTFFNSNNSLRTVLTLPSGIQEIGVDCFRNCSSLIAVNIPMSIISLNDAFRGCVELTEWVRDSSERTSGGVLNLQFSDTATCAATTFAISDTFVSGFRGSGYPLKGFNSLKELILPNMRRIGSYAIYPTTLGEFFGYTNYSETTKVTQNESDYYIPSSLKTVRITSLTDNYQSGLANYAFHNCSNLTTIECSGNEDYTIIPQNAFQGCTGLTSISSILKSGIVTVGSYAFQGCTGLISVEIPNTVTELYNDVFAGCNKITSVTFASTSKVSQIGNGCFNGCSKLSAISLPNSVTKLGNHVFYGCVSLSGTFTIPSACNWIGQCCFVATSLGGIVFTLQDYWWTASNGGAGTDWLMQGSGGWMIRVVTNSSTNSTNLRTNGSWSELWMNRTSTAGAH